MEPSAVSTLRGGIGIVEVLEMKVGEGNVVTAEPESNITSVSGEIEETTGEEATAFFALEAGGTDTLVGEEVDIGGVLDLTGRQLEQSLAEWLGESLHKV